MQTLQRRQWHQRRSVDAEQIDDVTPTDRTAARADDAMSVHQATRASKDGVQHCYEAGVAVKAPLQRCDVLVSLRQRAGFRPTVR